MIEHINWYPGHMKKTRELIRENLKQVDAVLEVLDARIPLSSRNPIIGELCGDKARAVILNKGDLSDPAENERWQERFRAEGYICSVLNSKTGQGFDPLMKQLSRLQDRKNEGRLRKMPLRLMIVGVPNVGKSSLINRLTGRKSAKTGDRPGITRGKQWLSLENGMQLLDTPGILWPKFEDPHVGLNLAFCGSIRDEILPLQDLGLELIDYLGENYPGELAKRYSLDEAATEAYREGKETEAAGGEIYDEDGMPLRPALALMEAIAKKRGFILSGKRIDYERCARCVLDEFRSGLIGNITLEKAPAL